MSNEIIVKEEGDVLHITLNRPDAGNGMTDAMAVEFADVVNAAHRKSEMILLDANGPDFCIGRAPRAKDAPPPSSDAYKRRDEYDPIFNAYWAIRRSPIPVVGVIRGRAMGFGLAVASLCDVSFASDKATFNIPEMDHNIMPTMVMSSVFDRMSRNAILWMTYSCEFISAERAMTYGIVSTVVPDDKLDATVAKFCDTMSHTPRPAIRGLKEFLRVAPTMDAQGGIDYARALHSLVNTSPEMKSKTRKH